MPIILDTFPHPVPPAIRINTQSRFSIILTADGNSPLFTPASIYTISAAAGTATVNFDDGNAPTTIIGFPFDLVPVLGDGGRTATYTLLITPTSFGTVAFRGALPDGTAGLDFTSIVFNAGNEVHYNVRQLQALHVTANNSLTPVTAEANEKFLIDLTVTNRDPAANVANFPIMFTLRRVTALTGDRVTKFFSNATDTTPIRPVIIPGSTDAVFTINTDATGHASVICVANNNAGFVQTTIQGFADQTLPLNIYHFDDTQDDTLSSPDVDLPIIGNNFNIINARDPFDVRIPGAPLINNGEFLGLILNGVAQSQISGAGVPVRNITLGADLSALRTDGGENILLYTISDTTRLRNSIRRRFIVEGGTIIPPELTDGLVGPITEPVGGFFTFGTFHDHVTQAVINLPVTIPLGNDIAALTARGITLNTDAHIVLWKTSVGLPLGQQQITSESAAQIFPIGPVGAAEQILPVDPTIWLDMRTPDRDTGTSGWTMRYGYVQDNNINSTPVARSIISSGGLDTVKK